MHQGYVVTRDRWTTSFSASHPPALEVDPPAVIAFETSDTAVARLLAGVSLEEIGFANLNPVTGPVIVSGSEPSDALAIEVLEITSSEPGPDGSPTSGAWAAGPTGCECGRYRYATGESGSPTRSACHCAR